MKDKKENKDNNGCRGKKKGNKPLKGSYNRKKINSTDYYYRDNKINEYVEWMNKRKRKRKWYKR